MYTLLSWALALSAPAFASEVGDPAAQPAKVDAPKKQPKVKTPKSRPKPARPVSPRPAPEATKRPTLPAPAPATRPARTAPPVQTAPSRPVKPVIRAPAPAEVRTTAREVAPRHAYPVAPPRPATPTRPTRPSEPLYRGTNHRYARPDPFAVVHPLRPPPRYVWYRPYWTHWWVHPYWRWTHATTVVVWFDFTPDPWVDVWVPPPRHGWIWVAGTRGPYWVPGYWVPATPAPVWYGASWTWVPGFWLGPAWIEGYWRPQERPGWVWVDGYYLDDGTYVRGWWSPAGTPPRRGYVWEPGYFDGKYWVEGFWRPSSRGDYQWVSAWLDDDGVYHAGYWEPLEDRPGMVWIPGWFDGDAWVEGYWVAKQEYEQADPDRWEPEAGWDAREPEGFSAPVDEGLPPALPVQGPGDTDQG